MSTETTSLPEPPLAPQPGAPAPLSPTRPLYWSVRRELWENRSIYLAPLIVSGLVIFGYAISAIGLPHRRRALLLLDPVRQRALVEQPYDFAAIILMLTAFLVGIFYCLDALHGERRDRSILFWKSLPVSDLTSVLGKLSVPLLVLPLITFVIIEITQLVILLMSTAALLPSGLGATSWERLPFFQLSVILLYGIITSVLWAAPVYGWLLLVSGWARRATFLWAVLPWLAVCIVEKIAFNSAYFAHILGRRLFGSYEDAFVVVPLPRGAVVPMVDRLSQLAPLKFLSSPGLWIGLVLAAAFLAAAVRLRRSRGPL
jgi:ABC-2 type transport system permease protein